MTLIEILASLALLSVLLIAITYWSISTLGSARSIAGLSRWDMAVIAAADLIVEDVRAVLYIDGGVDRSVSGNEDELRIESNTSTLVTYRLDMSESVIQRVAGDRVKCVLHQVAGAKFEVVAAAYDTFTEETETSVRLLVVTLIHSSGRTFERRARLPDSHATNQRSRW